MNRMQSLFLTAIAFPFLTSAMEQPAHCTRPHETLKRILGALAIQRHSNPLLYLANAAQMESDFIAFHAYNQALKNRHELLESSSSASPVSPKPAQPGISADLPQKIACTDLLKPKSSKRKKPIIPNESSRHPREAKRHCLEKMTH